VKPVELQALVRARLRLARGDADGARHSLSQALAREPDLPYVHAALAGMRWPGAAFHQVLVWLHELLAPALYLEIGVEKGLSLALARPPTQVVGVDPHPVGDPAAGCAAPVQLYAMASADFLRAPPAGCALRRRGFDLAFVDGDHRFEAVLDDFIALERWAAPGALLVLHDTLPLDPATAAPVRRTGFYTGDGWKLAPCLRTLRPELRMVTLPVAPTGLTLVAGLDPASNVLRSRRRHILDSYGPLDAARVVARTEAVMGPLGVNRRDWIADWLSRAGVQSRS
jgi:predicted O-methyltransferase YrrM